MDNSGLKPIREELDLGDRKKQLKGKTIRIKKLVKKDTGSFTLKDTLLHGDDSQNMSANEIVNDNNQGDFNANLLDQLNPAPPQIPANTMAKKETSKIVQPDREEKIEIHPPSLVESRIQSAVKEDRSQRNSVVSTTSYIVNDSRYVL